ncbi:MAG: alpha-glucan family phosphorylase [Alloprevotella sp.]|nr:alpha-glucan family phosphorylase [Bacteroidales bacterium]MDY2974307.1 alpha-glucan family phosphorylase [Alloprevotella sp.]MDD6501517.1 alpha-glucan family phosphorylase [Bacteroidales bacterium]MDD6538462.1 alpha-glucan family phosphorylase [Bacteroidales bacterium]MDD6554420.1 alpha-glucan family phosphorylase [Bacteroidales bacterium]
MNVTISNSNQPSWKVINVKSHIPEALKKLDELSHNLWWCWNTEALDLFSSLDTELWHKVRRNPIDLLRSIDYDRLIELSKNEEIIRKMNKVYADFRKYMDVKPDPKRASVAYFCMEYGLSHVLKIYSGGLGILAGDYLKEASDSNVDMVAVGFLYRYGYFTQSLSMDGQQIANYEPQDFDRLPIERVLDADGNQVIVDVPYPNFMVHATLWRANVGRISLYLLDTDNELNSEYDRRITHSLYGGDWENRIKQEYLLGIGGMLALNKLGIKKDVYHCNEGHAALCNVQRLAEYVESGLSFNQALELVRASSLYTVHTPVPAGHDYFDEGLFNKYMNQFPARLGISWDDFMGMGRTNPGDKNEKFCMSTFLCKTCQEVNGVSWLHGRVSQQMFRGIWPGYLPSPERLDHAERTHDEWEEIYNPNPEESHVGYVTNGVHLPTWCAKEWQAVYKKYLGAEYYHDQSNEKIWEKILQVPDEVIWNTRVQLKNKLIDYIRRRFRENWLKNQGDPSMVVSLLDKINPNALLIGFARRFATYKRAHLLFSDLDRLSKIVNNPKYPVQFLFAGKAHPADGAGQGLIKKIYDISQRPEFMGKILFLDNYDMQLARRLVSGVDIWMNTPTRPLEASGTSGEKALMNGVVNLSVLDGWWYEGYREGAGWALTDRRTYENQDHQDKLDASTIYSMLEQEIIPLYYARNRQGFSENWVRTVKNSIARIAPHYTMKRQLDDYYTRFYNPLAARFHAISADNNRIARDIAAWKESVAERWDSIKVVSSTRSENLQSASLISGKEFTVRHVVDEQGLDDAVGIDLVVMTGTDGNEHVSEVLPMKLVSREGNLHTFELTASIDLAGSYKVAYRLYPKHPQLANRQDMCYVRWFN